MLSLFVDFSQPPFLSLWHYNLVLIPQYISGGPKSGTTFNQLSQRVKPSKVDIRVFTFKNTIFALNLYVLCFSSFLRLHKWTLWINILSALIHFDRNRVFTFFKLNNSYLLILLKPDFNTANMYAEQMPSEDGFSNALYLWFQRQHSESVSSGRAWALFQNHQGSDQKGRLMYHQGIKWTLGLSGKQQTHTWFCQIY